MSEQPENKDSCFGEYTHCRHPETCGERYRCEDAFVEEATKNIKEYCKYFGIKDMLQRIIDAN